EKQVVRRKRREPPEPFAHDIERAVAIEQPLAALAADDGAKAEVAVAKLRFGGDTPGERAGIEGAGHRNWRVRDVSIMMHRGTRPTYPMTCRPGAATGTIQPWRTRQY